MLNPEATALSRNTIPEQMDYLKQSLPFMRKLHLTDASEDGKYAVDVKMDYFGGIDVYGKDLVGGDYNFQLKARKPEHTDLIFSVRKIKDADIRRNPNIGFNWHGEKYTFLTDNIDVFIEKVAGKNYTVWARDLMAMEQPFDGEDCPYIKAIYPQERFATDGHQFTTGDYYAFITPDKMMEFKYNLFLNENWDYYKEACTEAVPDGDSYM